MTIILSNLHLLKKMSLEDSLVNLQQLNGYHKSHRTLNVTTLPCETLMSAKQTLNDKLQGSVAACLRRGRVVNNQVKKGLLLSLLVKFFFKLVNIWQSYKQERDCLVHFLRLLAVCWPSAQISPCSSL